METPAGNSQGSWSGASSRPGARRPRGPAAGSSAAVPGSHAAVPGSSAAVLGSLTIPGHPAQVAAARAFVTRTLSSHRIGADIDSAALLTSEIVTNAILHTKSGVEGGTVTIVVIGIPRGVLIEVIDDGSAGTPIVKGDLYAAEGHGLFLVQNLAAQWGYLRDPAGTTVWFHLTTAEEPWPVTEQAGPQAGRRADRCRSFPPDGEAFPTRPSQLWAAAMHSAAAPALAWRSASPTGQW